MDRGCQFSFVFLSLQCFVSVCAASDAVSLRTSKIDFRRDIRPILSNHCFQCHGPDEQQHQTNLRLDTHDGALVELDSGGFAIVPGNRGASQLLSRIASHNDDSRMPPPETGKRLTNVQIDLLGRWIEQGATWTSHWAYEKPISPELPDVTDATWPEGAIDCFVLARLEQEGLRPSVAVDRYTLARRVFLDLIGLPPSLGDVETFVDDDRPNAYTRFVDRLLASPHYGEHRALRWLDLARYADTEGYDQDTTRDVSAYRDWVIQAFNQNMPFDQFTIEQLAGDLLPDALIKHKVATGFHRNTMSNRESGTVIEEHRVASVVDRINTTMTVWMGTTLGCAQCHSHKFDPFTQTDYYQLFAFFNNTEDEIVPGTLQHERQFVGPKIKIPTAAQRRQIKEIESQLALLKLATQQDGLSKNDLAKISEKISTFEKKRPSLRTALVMVERDKPRDTHVLIRGSYQNKGRQVSPGVPSAWHPWPVEKPRNRLGLAHWLVHPDNPLTARVMVNRLWAQRMGRHLVETSEDFGSQGSPPTHPRLLDFLATQLVLCSWNCKAIDRLIVTSATYRQTSSADESMREKDPDNRLYTRGSAFRIDAETIRDNALAISGLLNRTIGGASVKLDRDPVQREKTPNPAQFRRGLYSFIQRNDPNPMPILFDASTRNVCVVRRTRTNTPLQALTLLNDRTFFACAARLAQRLILEIDGDVPTRAAYGFRLCVARPPKPRELTALVNLYLRNFKIFRNNPQAAEQVVAENLPGLHFSSADVTELAAWSVVGNALLNLDETITRY